MRGRSIRNIAKCWAAYARHQSMPVGEIGYLTESGKIDLDDLDAKLSDKVAAVILQSPNFFGVIEDVRKAAEITHRHGALLILVFTEAVSLGLLEPPRDADIVAGELQSFAIPPSYGGPYAGIVATKEKFIRQMPGRIVGQTKDTRGQRAFCLTLSTREQHIRREKATSNICTNQALIALMATVYMTIYGRKGLRELAEQNLPRPITWPANCRCVSLALSLMSLWSRPTGDRRARLTRNC